MYRLTVVFFSDLLWFFPKSKQSEAIDEYYAKIRKSNLDLLTKKRWMNMWLLQKRKKTFKPFGVTEERKLEIYRKLVEPN